MHAEFTIAAGTSGRLRTLCVRAPLAAAVALSLAGFAQAATITVNDASVGPANPNDTTCSLQDAIAALNTAAHFGGCTAGDGNNDRIVLSLPAGTTLQFAVPSPVDNNSALSISKPVSIVGASDANHNPLITLTRSTVSGTPNFRLIATSADLSLDGFALSNGNAAESGGAVRATGYATVSLSNSTVTANSAVVSGGGIGVDCGRLTLYRTAVSNNSAGKSGGGVYVSDYLKTSSGTTTCSSGMTIGQSAVNNNTATIGSGGGAFSFNGDATISNSTISGNTTKVDGGGVYAYTSVQITSSTISNNTGQSGNGGGVWSKDVSTHGGHSIISGNTVPVGFGGGVYAQSTKLSTVTVSNNKAQCGAGGLHIKNDVVLDSSTIANNASGYSECQATGGLRGSTVTVTNSTFTGNYGGYYGYGALLGADVTLNFNTITGNRGRETHYRAGGVAFFSSAHMIGNIITGNTSNDVYTFPARTVIGDHNIVTTSNFVTLPADTITDCTPATSLHLGPLADNGGPTQTMALLTDSCAIDAGPDTTPLIGGVTTDQRGLPRPSGSAADIGAFELQDVIFKNGFDP